jgi:hypothetical protein
MQRIRDHLRERRIRAISRQMKEAAECGEPYAYRRVLWARFKAEVEARTPDAIKRMERGRGLR